MGYRSTVLKGFLLVILLVGLVGCSATRGDLDGAWELVEPGTLDPAGPAVKVLADGHFAFGRRAPGGGVGWAGGGTYTYDGEIYTETITYHYAETLVGTRIKFDCDLEDGTWRHRAKFEHAGETFSIDEVWQRVEK